MGGKAKRARLRENIAVGMQRKARIGSTVGNFIMSMKCDKAFKGCMIARSGGNIRVGCTCLRDVSMTGNRRMAASAMVNAAKDAKDTAKDRLCLRLIGSKRCCGPIFCVDAKSDKLCIKNNDCSSRAIQELFTRTSGCLNVPCM